MARLRLFERLQLLQAPLVEHPDEAMQQIESIRQHVQRLLYTHKGTAPISDDFGMPDLFFTQGINFKKNSQQMQNAISSVIKRFEPRLERITVEPLSSRDDLLKQQFRIKGLLKSDTSIMVDFVVEISSEARIKLITGAEKS